VPAGSRKKIHNDSPTNPPRQGEHNDEVLRDCGYSPGQIAQLREKKLFFKDRLPFSWLGLRARKKQPIDLVKFCINDEAKSILRFFGGFGLSIHWLKSDLIRGPFSYYWQISEY